MASSRYNPRGDTRNCGFCAISYALERLQLALPDKKLVWFNADQLYERKLKRLHLTPDEAKGFPRELIFPERDLDKMKVSVAYGPLKHGVRALSSYTITHVAEEERLVFNTSGLVPDLGHSARRGNQTVPRHFIDWYMARGVGNWCFKDFVQTRLELLEDQAGRDLDAVAIGKHVTAELAGDSIVGSRATNHFMNIHIDPATSHVQAYDPQTDDIYDGKGLRSRLIEVQLFMHLEKQVGPSPDERVAPNK